RRLEETCRAQDREDQGRTEGSFTVTLLVEPAQPRRKKPVERRRWFAVLLVEAVQVEPQVALLDAADDQLKRLRAFLDGPARAERGQALQHVVLEVVGIHRRLLAHCGCNEVPEGGLQAVARVSHAV